MADLKSRVLRFLDIKYPNIWYATGEPDILLCYNGHFIAIELRVPTGRITELQANSLDRILDAGGVARVCRSVQEVDDLLINVVRFRGAR